MELRNTHSTTRLSWNPITWVLNGLDTIDPRSDKPVPTTNRPSYWKVGGEQLSAWKRPTSPPPQFYSRHSEREVYRMFCPASRSHQWSTLREMLPTNSERQEEETSDDKVADSTDLKQHNRQKLLPSRCRGKHGLTYSPITK